MKFENDNNKALGITLELQRASLVVTSDSWCKGAMLRQESR